MTIQWTQQDRKLLDAILDQLIPANPDKGIPSAGAFGVGEFIASRAADDDAVSTALNELLIHARTLTGPVNVEFVSQLEVWSTSRFTVLLRQTYMGYYSRSEIRSLLGLAAWPVHPKGYEVDAESSHLMEQLTAPVKARGPCYREPQAAAQGAKS